MEKPHYNLPTQIFDRNNQLVTEIYTEHRMIVSIEAVPDTMKNAFFAGEDSRFYDHFGIDPIRIRQALFIDINKM
ncbi:transglycosylase domain-containing protein [bacterium]|nr:transglycosylase domain-containing protein [bacterium]